MKWMFVSLYGALVRPHLVYVIQESCPYLKNDKFHQEIIQSAATRWVKGLEDSSYKNSYLLAKAHYRLHI